MSRECGLDKNGDAIVREAGGGALLRFPREDLKDIYAISDYTPFDFEMAVGDVYIPFLLAFPFGKVKDVYFQVTDATTGAPIDISIEMDITDGFVFIGMKGKLTRLDVHLATPVIAGTTTGIQAIKFQNTNTVTVRARGYVAAF